MWFSSFAIILFIFHFSYSKDLSVCKWGNKFDVPLQSNNVRRECKLPDERPVCCAALEESTFPSHGVGYEYSFTPSQPVKTKNKQQRQCTIKKQYVSSPQEQRDLAYAWKLQKIADFNERFEALMHYVTSVETIQNSTRWLARIAVHMQSENNPTPVADDYEYLSRFLVTRTCAYRDSSWNSNILPGSASTQTDEWIEWIEPITITARHPFGFGTCRPTSSYYSGKNIPKTGRSDVDYVLLQSGKHLFQQQHNSQGLPVAQSQAPSPAVTGSLDQDRRLNNNNNKKAKAYFFDAGTSTFDSSLFWFTCGYSQRKVSFDQVFGWELTLLEPNDYWGRVPAKWLPYWHFYNVPISSDEQHAHSPLRLIKSLASAHDFVAVKLDIDTPGVELPIALSLLSPNGTAAQLIDEFFFELHFQCEVMTSCGWGKRVPAESHGLTLDRPHVLEYFISLREKSLIRAHIWP